MFDQLQFAQIDQYLAAGDGKKAEFQIARHSYYRNAPTRLSKICKPATR
jgi:hypothetical protein